LVHLLGATTLVVGATAIPLSPHHATAVVAGTNAYTAVSPTRVLDSRIGLGVPARLAARSSFVLDIGGLTPVPTTATAVVLNVTATNPDGPGYVSAWPPNVAQPTTSIINFESAGQTIANLVTVPMDADGNVAFFTQTGVDLIADVQGYYSPAPLSAAGRFTPMTPTRVLDTRLTNSIHTGLVGQGEAVTVDFKPWGVAADAIAVVLNVTVTEATAPGFWTAYAAGAERPVASNLNVTTAGQTIPNQVITPVANGAATFFSQNGGHLIIDISGYYTGASAPVLGDGLFVPVSPHRLVDTRDPANGGPAKPGASSRVSVPVGGRFGIPTSGVAAVVITATVTDTNAAGFFTVWPDGTVRPTVSNLNAVHANQTIANHATVPVSPIGFDFFTQTGANLLADVTGWFTGLPTTGSPSGPIPKPPPVPAPGPGGPPDSGGYLFTFAAGPGATVEFNQADPQFVPFHWNPCKPIRYVVNMNGYDESFRSIITDDIARVATATGFTFTYVGDSTFIPTNADPWGHPLVQFRDGLAPYDIIISLANETITDLVPGGLAGLAFPNYFRFNGFDGRFIVSSVTIDMGDIGSHDVWAGDGLGPVLMHELGHSMGLAHVPDDTQIMFSGAFPDSPNTYSGGDLRGLYLVGAKNSCTNFGP